MIMVLIIHLEYFRAYGYSYDNMGCLDHKIRLLCEGILVVWSTIYLGIAIR